MRNILKNHGCPELLYRCSKLLEIGGGTVNIQQLITVNQRSYKRIPALSSTPLVRVSGDSARQAGLQELKIDDDPPQAAIAIAKGMDGLKIQVKSGCIHSTMGAQHLILTV